MKFRFLALTLVSFLIAGVLLPAIALAQSTTRKPKAHIIFLIDVSGSMGWPALLSEAEIQKIPADVVDKILEYKKKVESVVDVFTEAEREQVFACNYSCMLTMSDGTYRTVEPLPSTHPQYELSNEVTKLADGLKPLAQEHNIQKLNSAIHAIQSFLDTLIVLKVTGFSATTNFVQFDWSALKLDEEIASDLSRAREAVGELQAGSGTNIGSGLEKVFSLIEEKGIEGKIKLIFLSDGRTTDGLDRSAILEKFPKLAKEKGVTIDALGFGIHEVEIDSDLLRRLATETGGTYSFNTTSIELSESFLASAHETIGQKVIEKEIGLIKPDSENLLGAFKVKKLKNEFLITVGQSLSDLQIVLKDKKGKVVPKSKYKIRQEGNVIVLNLKKLKKGKYSVYASSASIPEEGVDYTIIVSEKLKKKLKK